MGTEPFGQKESEQLRRAARAHLLSGAYHATAAKFFRDARVAAEVLESAAASLQEDFDARGYCAAPDAYLRERVDRAARDRQDADLILRVRAGDPDAFPELRDRHVGWMLREARQWKLGWMAEEDVVQDVWTGLWVKGLDRYQSTGSFRAWLSKVLRNRLSSTRKRAIRRNEESLDSSDGEDSFNARRGRYFAEANTEEEALRSIEVRQLMDGLPHSRAHILRALYLDGVPAVELAATMGVTQARVSQLRKDALAKLRALSNVPAHGPDRSEKLRQSNVCRSRVEVRQGAS